jgi:hypothetical protein
VERELLVRAREPVLRVRDPLLRELALVDRLPDRVVRGREVLDRARVRRRVVVARCARGTAARTTSLTKRPSSASRNFAMRSSSRLIAFESCAVSRSPTVSANVWMRE